MLGIVALSAGISLLCLLGLGGLVAWALAATTLFQTGWLELATDILGTMAGFLVPLLLFPAFMPLIAGMFEERILTLVEQADYPDTPPPSPRPFLPALLHDVRFVVIALSLNLLLLPLYFIPLLGQGIFLLLNGYLMGREFFGIAAGRHLGKAEANRVRKRIRMRVLLAGMALAAGTLVPLLNLLVPFAGLVLMAHLYHGTAKHYA
jgi:uncharacterized protein involved in cysteine biosynthesis